MILDVVPLDVSKQRCSGWTQSDISSASKFTHWLPAMMFPMCSTEASRFKPFSLSMAGDIISGLGVPSGACICRKFGRKSSRIRHWMPLPSRTYSRQSRDCWSSFSTIPASFNQKCGKIFMYLKSCATPTLPDSTASTAAGLVRTMRLLATQKTPLSVLMFTRRSNSRGLSLPPKSASEGMASFLTASTVTFAPYHADMSICKFPLAVRTTLRNGGPSIHSLPDKCSSMSGEIGNPPAPGAMISPKFACPAYRDMVLVRCLMWLTFFCLLLC
mmetsp:Transcript_9280/g.20786  ORF Transcript_9280/g.20786 Transcript_9280/m.20786 type:complete len:272 (+) Transcript_9280:461-1276(+)